MPRGSAKPAGDQKQTRRFAMVIYCTLPRRKPGSTSQGGDVGPGFRRDSGRIRFDPTRVGTAGRGLYRRWIKMEAGEWVQGRW